MKSIRNILFASLFVWGVIGTYGMSTGQAQSSNEEFRATWVITWEHISSGSSVAENKARVRQILDNHVRANMNAILWQVRQGGTAYYTSSYEPWGYYAGGNYPGYDPLAYVIKEAHKRGLEVHAWFNTFHTSSDAPGTPVNEHPEWVCRDGYGNPMSSSYAISPGLEDVRDYTLNVAMEVVNNYDIDGLHLDYIRWNEYTNSSQSEAFARTAREQRFLDGMITPGQIEELQETADRDRYLYDPQHPYSGGIPSGFDSWEDWWRASVTTFVQSLHDSIQSVKPWVRLSVAALGNYRWGGWQGYGTVYQDAALWFNEGYIDQLTPMHYHWTTGDGFYGMLTAGGSNSWEYWIEPGINAGRLFTVGPGSYILLQDNIWGRHPGIINRTREVSWTDGFQFFSYGSWDSYDYWEAAGNSVFPALTKVRATGLIDDTSPDAPELALNKLDSLHYEISVTPATSVDGINQWHAIYRSEDDQFDIANDRIVSLNFDDSTFVATESFTGLQDYDGEYYYFATTLDRYWNESSTSNSELTDPIPSFPPTVMQTHPQAGDSVPVNAQLSITFSKTMDTTAVENSLSLDPATTIGIIEWSADNKTIFFRTENSLEYDTEYTLQIADQATDVNGRSLDGDSNGTAGGSFILQFHTLTQDVTGPSVISSYPAQNQTVTDFDVAGVVAIVFDELIDPSSVTVSSVSLTDAEGPVEFGYNVTQIADFSVLGIQPLTRFAQSGEYTVSLESSITDTVGNEMAGGVTFSFECSPFGYAAIEPLDEFFSIAAWHEPEFSGSTVGIYDTETNFALSTDAYLPGASSRQQKSAELSYHWDPEASNHLLRLYCMDGSAPKSMLFDTTYTLQMYVYGDGSNNLFRFALDDGTSGGASLHEVSAWTTINWTGWRLIEWDLGEPNSFGSWIGNQQFDNPNSLRFDSIQLGYGDASEADQSRIFFDNLRIVQKTTDPVAIEKSDIGLPAHFTVQQNYPNPFNPVTNIGFTLPENGEVQLVVYDISGHIVQVLKNGHMQAGRYVVPFDGSSVSSGIYFYQLKYNGKQSTRRMALIK